MTVFATSDDVRNALRRDLTAGEEEFIEAVIDEAQDLVVAYLNRGPEPYESEADVPGPVTRITARMVARVFQQATQATPIGATQGQATAGPYSLGNSFAAGSTSGNPWLSASDKTALARYRKGGGLTSMALASERG